MYMYYLKLPQTEQEATSTNKRVTQFLENISVAGHKCVCLNARTLVNKKNELNIMTEDINPHITGITESSPNEDIVDTELGLTGYVVFRRDRIGRRGGGIILYITEYI